MNLFHGASKCRKGISAPAGKAACCGLSGLAGYIHITLSSFPACCDTLCKQKQAWEGARDTTSSAMGWLSLWPDTPSARNKPTHEQRRTEMFVQTLISSCTFPLGLCNVRCVVCVWACRMHYGGFRRTCTAHFPRQTPKTTVAIKYNQTVTLTWL